MDKETTGKITKIFDDLEKAMGLSLAINAEDIASITAQSTAEYLSKMHRTEYTKAFVDGITDKITKDYKDGIQKGGSWCINPVYEDIGGGKVRATTRAEFVPWLDDFNAENRKTVMDIFIDGEKGGVYPLDMADQIKGHFENTHHRAQVAARTESQKIAQDARIQGYKKSNVKYVEYITAGDERVRPEHEQRDGKIYPIDKAPFIGEYQCRCILTEADYAVEEEGAKVEEDDGIIMSKEALGLE
jgi:SPP1 gp7 family putative phage head morphogenesis protein